MNDFIEALTDALLDVLRVVAIFAAILIAFAVGTIAVRVIQKVVHIIELAAATTPGVT